MNVNKIMFGFGLFLVLLAAALLVLDVIGSGFAAAIGMLGIGFIAVSRRRTSADSTQRSPREQIEQTIYSPDKKQRALIKQRADGNYQIEVQKFIHEHSPDVGSYDRWERTSSSICDSINDALETAALRVGAGTGNFFGGEG